MECSSVQIAGFGTNQEIQSEDNLLIIQMHSLSLLDLYRIDQRLL